VLVYKEPFSQQQLIGFALVWSAVIVFGSEGILARTRATPVLDEGEF
jgi:EamA domain-containing membrane protein RarD